MGIVDHARRELTLAGMFDKDSDYGGMLGHAVLKMIKQFAGEGHSGFSANMAVSLFERLARFEPLSPLSGADEEWQDIGGMNGSPMWQNRRCSHVFKSPDDGVYDINGRIFREPDGSCFTNRESRVTVTFPYSPKPEYVDVPARQP